MLSDQAGDVKIEDIIEASGTDPNACYQCGKCTAGCPLTFAMDYPPMVLLRLLQVGNLDLVLNSKAIWQCTSCGTCTARCPRGIDVAGLVNALRIMAGRKGKVTQGQTQVAFNKVLLKSLRANGRIYDTGKLLSTKFGSSKLSEVLPMILPILSRGKIKLLPSKIKGRKQIGRIFAAATGGRELE